MEYERKASNVMNNPLNKLIYFFDKSHITEQIIDHYTDALDEYTIEKNQEKMIEIKKKLISLYQGINNNSSKHFIAVYSEELGDDLLKTNNIKEAEKYYNKAIDIKKDSSDSYYELNRTYEHIADSYYTASRYDMAYKFYDQLVESYNNTKISVLNNLVVCCIKQGKYEKASTILSNKMTTASNKYLVKYMTEKYYLESVACSLLISPGLARDKLAEFTQNYKITDEQKITIIKMAIDSYEICKFSGCIKHLEKLFLIGDILTSITECLKEKKIRCSTTKVQKTLGDKLILSHNDNRDYHKKRIKNNLLKDVRLPNGALKADTQGDNLVKAFYSDADDLDLC